MTGLPAIGEGLGPPAALELPEQESLADASVDHLPGEELVGRALPEGVGVGVEPDLGEGAHPRAHVPLIVPGVEAGAQLPRALHHVGQPAIAARQHSLQERGLGMGGVELQAATPDPAPQQGVLLADGLTGGQRHPLERGVRFGDEGVDADVDLRLAPVNASADDVDRVDHVGDGLDVLHPLAGEPDHEVELDGLPAALEDLPGHVEHLLGWNGLVDHGAHAVGAGLGCEGEPGVAAARDGLGQGDGETVGPEGGQGDGEMLVAEALDHLRHQYVDLGVIAGGEGEESDLLKPGLTEDGLGRLQNLLHRPFADRAHDHPGVAEAAAPRTSPVDLDGGTIVADVHGGDDEARGGRWKGGDDTLGDGHLRLWDVDLDGGQGAALFRVRRGSAVVPYVVEAGHVDAG